MIKNNFLVNGVPFAHWFNRHFRFTQVQLFPNPIHVDNFLLLMDNLKTLTGKEEITLSEFCGHIAIILNETGGLFAPIREQGGPAYMFNTLMPGGGTKHSYNKEPNRLAGNQLKEWGIISKAADIDRWNGQIYPWDAPLEVRILANRCDFYRFRGWGFNQITWRDAYEQCLEPLLPQKIDTYCEYEFEEVLKDFELACATFYNYTHLNPIAQFALAELEKGNFEAYGNLVSGGWTWYVQYKYLPRCKALLNALKSAEIQNIEKLAIDGLGLTALQIKELQDLILHFGNHEAAELMTKNGGADGSWGPASERAFKLLGISIQELLHIASRDFEIDDLTIAQIKQIQMLMMESGNEKVAKLVRDSGGADGNWGRSTQQAFELLNTKIKDLLKAAQADIPIEQLNRKQIVQIQKAILNSGNRKAIKLIKDGGSADGFWGKNTRLAFDMLKISIRALLKIPA